MRGCGGVELCEQRALDLQNLGGGLLNDVDVRDRAGEG